MMTYGEYIKFKRLSKKYSQRKLGLISGVSNTTISRMEKNETPSPEIETLKSLEKALGLQENEIVNIAYPSSSTDEKTSKDTYTGEELKDKIPDEFKELFGEDGLKYIEFAKEMKEEEITPEMMRELFETLKRFKDQIK